MAGAGAFAGARFTDSWGVSPVPPEPLYLAPDVVAISPAARAHLSSSELFKRDLDWDDGREGRPLPRDWVGQWSLAVSIPQVFLFSRSSFCFFGHAAQPAGSSFPTQGLNLRCPQWKPGVLTPDCQGSPPGVSRVSPRQPQPGCPVGRAGWTVLA